MPFVRTLVIFGALCVGACVEVPLASVAPTDPFIGTRQGLMKTTVADDSSPLQPSAGLPAVFRMAESEGRVVVVWSVGGLAGGGMFEPEVAGSRFRASPARPISGASCRRLRIDGPKLSMLCIGGTEAWAYELEMTAERGSLRALLLERSTDDGTVRRSYDGRLVRSTKTTFD
ncbi:MAG: hypothetical protein FJX35_25460 [Alphaproteobacteria bacterium]|nr:hypothetical protein [Alphaproteobacteria bacterium]